MRALAFALQLGGDIMKNKSTLSTLDSHKLATVTGGQSLAIGTGGVGIQLGSSPLVLGFDGKLGIKLF